MRKIISLMVLATFTLSLLPVNVLIAEGSGHVSNSHTLYAGQDIEVGTVTTSNDTDNIYVEYILNDDAKNEGWCITETHVHVWEEDDAKPTNRSGNPVPGQFDYKENHDPCVTAYEYKIPLNEGWDSGDDLNIAAHAVVELPEISYTEKNNFCVFSGDNTKIDSKEGIEAELAWGSHIWNYRLTETLNDTAEWVWKTEYVENPRDGGLVDFFESFEVKDTLLNAELKIAADNAFEVKINETIIDTVNLNGEWRNQLVFTTEYLPDPSPNAWSIVHTYDVKNYLEENDNTMMVTGVNAAWNTDDPMVNLAGVRYQLCIESETEIIEREAENETAWAGDIRFTKKGNWATYFEYTVMEEEPEICSIEKYTLDIASVNGNTGFTHEFVLYYNLNLNYIYGTGDSHAGTQTLSHFDHETTADGILEYIEFRSDYDATTYFWFPAFDLLENGELKYVNIGRDNVNDATGSWKSECAYNLLETVEVDSKEIDGIQSVNELNKDEIYKFVASGTWKNGNVHTAVDAEYRLPVSATEWESSVGRSLRLQVNEGYFNWSDGVFNPNHIYKAYFTGDGSTVNFRINDGDPLVADWYGDNEGSLTVEIYKVW